MILQDVDLVLGLEVPLTPALAPGPAQAELFASIVALLAGLGRPSVAIIEDLHWAGSESVALLNHLIARLGDRPVVFVLTMRNDESQVEKAIPGANVIELNRFNRQEIHQLTAAMLGDGTVSRRLVEQLNEQSEGNAFFPAETTLRVAEEAGRLDRMGEVTSASSITSQGVQDLIDRRLERLPQPCRPLLELAALMGRRLDLPILAALEPQTDMNGWLMACTQAALLDVQDQVWQFKHDKIWRGDRQQDPARPPCRLSPPHRSRHRVDASGSGLAVRRADAPLGRRRHAAEGTRHREGRHSAGDRQERDNGGGSVPQAGDRLDQRPPGRPCPRCGRAGLAVAARRPPGRDRGVRRARRSPRFRRRSQAQRKSGRRRLAGSRLLGPLELLHGSNGTGARAAARGRDRPARPGLQCSDVVRLGGHLQAAAQFWRGELQGLERPIEDFLAGLHRTNGQLFAIAPQEDPEVQAPSYLAWLLWLRGRPDEAEEKSDQAIAVAQTLERRDHLAFALGFAAQYSAYRRDFKRASLLADASITLAERHGFPFWLAAARILRGADGAERQEARGDRRAGGGSTYLFRDRRTRLPAVVPAAAGARLSRDGRSSDRADDFGAGQDRDRRDGERINEAEILRNLGEIAYRLGETETAEETLETAIAVARRQGALAFELRATVSLAWLLRGAGRKRVRVALKLACEAFPTDCSWTELTAARALLKQFSN